MILEAAYGILDESGIGAVGIKAIATKLGCSTQPISWHFGSMTDLKKELFRYAGEKLYAGIPEQMEGKKAIDAFFASGVYYISSACDHPNVFRFTNVDDPMDTIGEPAYGESSGKRLSGPIGKWAGNLPHREISSRRHAGSLPGRRYFPAM